MKRVLAFTLAGLCLLSMPAFGQSRSDLSKIQKVELIKRIDAGEEAYESGNFERALREYTRAYEILPDPGFHFRIALANERLGNDEAALEQYRLYLEKRPDAEKRGQVERTIALLEQSMAQKERVLVSVRVEPAISTIKLFDAASGELLAEGPSPLESKLEAAPIRVVAVAEGHETLTRELSIEPGKDATIELEMRPEAVAEERSLTMPIVATSVAVVTTAATIVSLVLYSSASDDLDGFRAKPREFSRDEADEAASEANLFQGLSWAFGAASVLTIGWAVYEWTKDKESDDEVKASIGLSPTGPAARIRW